MKWQEAIKKAFHDMNKRNIWRQKTQSVLPSNRCCNKSKFIFEGKKRQNLQSKISCLQL